MSLHMYIAHKPATQTADVATYVRGPHFTWSCHNEISSSMVTFLLIVIVQHTPLATDILSVC